jgi:hypothetical protein
MRCDVTDQDAQGVPATTPEPTAPAAGTGETSDQTTAEPELTDEEKAAKADKDNRRAQRSYQRRLDELTRARRDAEREAEHWRSLAQQGQQPQRPAEDEPKEADYKDYAKYIEDRAAWRVRQEVAQAEAQRQESHDRASLAEKAEKARTLIEKASDKYEDFEEVAFRPDVAITQAMFEAMADSEFIADIAYHLGKHPDQAQRIARMSPFAAAREIGRIEANFTAKPEPKVTAAPAPARVIRTSTSPPGDLSQVKDIDQWMKMRNKQVRESG